MMVKKKRNIGGVFEYYSFQFLCSSLLVLFIDLFILFISLSHTKTKIGGVFEYCGLQFSDSHDNNHLSKSANLSKSNLRNIILSKIIMKIHGYHCENILEIS